MLKVPMKPLVHILLKSKVMIMRLSHLPKTMQRILLNVLKEDPSADFHELISGRSVEEDVGQEL